jgi:hypothetical protein
MKANSYYRVICITTALILAVASNASKKSFLYYYFISGSETCYPVIVDYSCPPLGTGCTYIDVGSIPRQLYLESACTVPLGEE